MLNKGPPSLGHHCLEQSQTVVTLADRADFQEKKTEPCCNDDLQDKPRTNLSSFQESKTVLQCFGVICADFAWFCWFQENQVILQRFGVIGADLQGFQEGKSKTNPW